MRAAVIEAERVRLDALTPDDAEEVFRYCQDEDLQRWIPVPQPYTIEDAHYFVGPHVRSSEAGETLTIWAIRDERGLLGLIELRFEPLRSATVGFWLGSEHRGRGLMTEALRALIRYSFDEAGLGLTRLQWQSAVGNHASALVARRTGFRYEGSLRGAIEHRAERLDSWQGTLLVSDDRAQTDGWPL